MQNSVSNEISLAAFARHRGVSRATVTEYKKKGYLVLTEAGKVCVKESEESLKAKLDKSRGGAREKPAASGESDGNKFMEAKTRDMQARALRSELELREKAGQLISKEAVKRAAFSVARDAQETLMAIPDRLASMLAAETDEAKVHEMLTDEIRQASNALADAVSESMQ